MTGRSEWYAPQERGQNDAGVGLLTLVLGAALGAAAALLVTSKAGQELRAQIAGATGGWKDHAAEALAQGRERLIDAVEHSHGLHKTGEGPHPGGYVAARD